MRKLARRILGYLRRKVAEERTSDGTTVASKSYETLPWWPGSPW